MRRFLILLIVAILGILLAGVLLHLSASEAGNTNGYNLVTQGPLQRILNPQVNEPQSSRNFLLPDIIVTAPKTLTLRRSADGSGSMRFSTTFQNQGSGPLEIFGHHDKKREITYAAQYVYEDGGPGEYRNFGEFVFHPTHRHWHVEDYVVYELWSTNAEGQADQVIAKTDKMSFCLWDENSEDLMMPGAPQSRAYPRNCDGVMQGISVGWSDTYAANIDGQVIEFPAIPDAIYQFHSIANPDKAVLESDYSNNTNVTTIELRGNRLTVR